MKERLILLLTAVVVFFIPAPGRAQDTGTRTVWDGIYSEGQASRGQAEFAANCRRCHGDIVNPRIDTLLRGDNFMERWREDTLNTYFTFIRTNMPPAPRGSNIAPRLSENTYVDVLTYIMAVNGFPAGPSELTADMIPNILLVGKDGPRPLPNSSLVQLVGCLVQGPNDGWTLIRATEPARTRESDEATEAELAASAVKPLGTQTFALSNLGYIGPDFRPDPYFGQKLQIKGYVIRQPNAERISVTSFEKVADTCTQ